MAGLVQHLDELEFTKDKKNREGALFFIYWATEKCLSQVSRRIVSNLQISQDSFVKFKQQQQKIQVLPWLAY